MNNEQENTNEMNESDSYLNGEPDLLSFIERMVLNIIRRHEGGTVSSREIAEEIAQKTSMIINPQSIPVRALRTNVKAGANIITGINRRGYFDTLANEDPENTE